MGSEPIDKLQIEPQPSAYDSISYAGVPLALPSMV